MRTSHESPTKQIRTVASSFNGSGSVLEASPALPWATSSPLYQFDCFSPGEGSNMSFTMTSPPCQIQSFGADPTLSADHNINAFSPSIFSPKETKSASRFPKKRDLYKDPNTQVRGGIAELPDKVSPESQSESRSSIDLPHALSSLLDSPHYSLWSSVQSAVGRNGSDLFQPPTPTALLSSGGLSGPMTEERQRLWGQSGSSSSDAHLFSATSQAMQISASPLLDGEYFLQGKKGNKARKLGRRSPAEDIMDAGDGYNAYDHNAQTGNRKVAVPQQGAGRGTGRKKKPYVSPDSSLDASSVAELVSLSSASKQMLSPAEASSVDKLSAAVKNQKLNIVTGISKLANAPGNSASAGSSSSGRRLKTQPSVLENYDLSLYFDAKHAEEHRGDDSNTSAARRGATSSSAVVADATVCNCKKSKCLKLYCDCFAVMNYCSAGCNCYDCCNTTDREATRQEAIRSTKERNAMAFQTKINDKDQHATGCHCKNSQCLKKYCECYTGGAFCGTNCKCMSCLNFNGSADLVKARSSMRDSDGPGSSRKRKESPSSVAFLDNTTPPTGNGKGALQVVHSKDSAQNIAFSPDLREAVAAVTVGGSGGSAVTVGPRNPAMTQLPSLRPALVGMRGLPTIPPAPLPAHNLVATPTQPSSSSSSSLVAGAVVTDQALPVAKRSKTHTPVPVDRQLRSRKLSGDAEEVTAHATQAAAAAIALAAAGNSSSNSKGKQATGTVVPIKKRHVKFAPIPIVYPFFGAHLPQTSKLIALRCLDYLEGKDIYAMSQVNTLWLAAAMDDAMWE